VTRKYSSCCRTNRQRSWTFNFVAGLLPVQRSRPCWIQLCCQCVPGFSVCRLARYSCSNILNKRSPLHAGHGINYTSTSCGSTCARLCQKANALIDVWTTLLHLFSFRFILTFFAVFYWLLYFHAGTVQSSIDHICIAPKIVNESEALVLRQAADNFQVVCHKTTIANMFLSVTVSEI